MKLVVVLLAGACIWLLIEREKLTAAREEAERMQARNSGNWVQDRINNTPRMLEAKPKVERRAPYYVPPRQSSLAL
jgi:hypothetical protein